MIAGVTFYSESKRAASASRLSQRLTISDNAFLLGFGNSLNERKMSQHMPNLSRPSQFDLATYYECKA